MDIGTAKPSAQELALVPHHLIDIRDPLHAYSAAEFARDATVLMADIRARGKLPLVVGGTMLYLKALQDGIDDLPKTDAATREAIEKRAKANGWSAMHEELRKVDPVTAARLAPKDSQRISRALEVWYISGKSLSAWFQEGADKRLNTQHESASGKDIDIISLEPNDRAWLHARIEQRFASMLTAGFRRNANLARAW
jgi:tRNA dimethylallyltransferase